MVIPDLKQIECIAKGASVSQSAVMTKTQQRCFIDLNDSQFIYGLAPQFRLTAELALTIHMNSTGDISSSNLKAFTSARIPVADSIKLLNLMDKSAQEAMVKHPKDVISLLKPRYRDIEQPYLRREDVKRSWTEKSRNIFHPGVIISALSHNYNRNFNFANDGNPYGVSELAFHMMGLGRDFFIFYQIAKYRNRFLKLVKHFIQT